MQPTQIESVPVERSDASSLDLQYNGGDVGIVTYDYPLNDVSFPNVDKRVVFTSSERNRAGASLEDITYSADSRIARPADHGNVESAYHGSIISDVS